MKILALMVLVLSISGSSAFAAADIVKKKRKHKGHWENGHYVTDVAKPSAAKPAGGKATSTESKTSTETANPYGGLDYSLRDKTAAPAPAPGAKKPVRVILPSPYEGSQVPGTSSAQ